MYTGSICFRQCLQQDRFNYNEGLVTCADTVLRQKAFKIASDMVLEENCKGLASMVYKCFAKQTNSLHNQRMASKLHKRIARKIRKKTYFKHQ